MFIEIEIKLIWNNYWIVWKIEAISIKVIYSLKMFGIIIKFL